VYEYSVVGCFELDGLLGFWDGRGLLNANLEQVASLVNSLPVFIRPAGVKRDGFVTEGTCGERCNVWHRSWPPATDDVSSVAQETDALAGAAEGCVRDTASLAGYQTITSL